MAAGVTDGTVEMMVPMDVSGQTYAFVTNANVTAVSDGCGGVVCAGDFGGYAAESDV
jgi:hypothetical protein